MLLFGTVLNPRKTEDIFTHGHVQQKQRIAINVNLPVKNPLSRWWQRTKIRFADDANN